MGCLVLVIGGCLVGGFGGFGWWFGFEFGGFIGGFIVERCRGVCGVCGFCGLGIDFGKGGWLGIGFGVVGFGEVLVCGLVISVTGIGFGDGLVHAFRSVIFKQCVLVV